MSYVVHSETELGLLLRARWRRNSGLLVTWREIISAERRINGRGFTLHLRTTEKPVRLVIPSSGMRQLERRLRDAGVRIVDEYGGQIDESQFTKEADPSFNKNVKSELPGFWWTVLHPNFVLRWQHERRMRQSSDDA